MLPLCVFIEFHSLIDRYGVAHACASRWWSGASLRKNGIRRAKRATAPRQLHRRSYDKRARRVHVGLRERFHAFVIRQHFFSHCDHDGCACRDVRRSRALARWARRVPLAGMHFRHCIHAGFRRHPCPRRGEADCLCSEVHAETTRSTAHGLAVGAAAGSWSEVHPALLDVR